MEKSISEKRFSAILALQNKQKRQKQGSYLFEINDKAIDLALSPTRQVNDFLIRNLKRDAKRILKRRKDTAPEFTDLVYPEGETDLNTLENQAMDPVTPYCQIVFSNYQALIYTQCKSIHHHALYVLNDLEEDIPIKDTALALRISESLVKKIRVQLKHKIQSILNN